MLRRSSSSSIAAAAVGAVGAAALTYNALKSVPVEMHENDEEKHEDGKLPEGQLDLRRMAQIARAKPTDHCGEVILVPTSNFDLNKTIFASLDSIIARAFIQDKVAVKLFWEEKAERKIHKEFASVPRAPSYDAAIIEFMNEECDFAVEHADGSFMDHLKFCFEYSHAHFPNKSPRVLLLHSIMGVGTNFFPMDASKIPKLHALVTEEEFQHIQIFPTMLRLLQSGLLMDDLLEQSKEQLDQLASFTCHRVIDNKKVTVTAEQFFDHLNYQLIHLLDFLPCSSWKQHVDDAFLKHFSDLYKILKKNKQLRCRLDYNAEEGSSSSEGLPRTIVSLLRGIIPSKIAITMAKNALKTFSKKINHSLEYTMEYTQ